MPLEKGIYKFLHSDHTSAMLDAGIVQIGSLSHYRELEGTDQWIADQLEGRVTIEPGNLKISENGDSLTPILPHSLKNLVRVESGGEIHIAAGVKITIEHPDAYIFSSSIGDLAELTATMCRDSEEKYDACIRIRHIEHLAHRLFFRGKILDAKETKMSHCFSEFQCSKVTYDFLSRTVELGQAPEASPFLKDKKFARQCEFRIAFWPRRPMGRSTLRIRVPKPAQLFEPIFPKRL